MAPSAIFTGAAEIAGTHLDLSGWRGMVGHNWGTDHADRWIWLHAFGLGERDPDGWLDYASPDGGAKEVSNCSIATATVRLGAGPEFVLHRAVAVEIGG